MAFKRIAVEEAFRTIAVAGLERLLTRRDITNEQGKQICGSNAVKLLKLKV